jgi:hypothetical protein
MGGTLTIRQVPVPGLLVLHLLGCVERRSGCGGLSGTLLGPEGAAVMVGSSVPAPVRGGLRTVGWWVVGRCLRTAQWTRASVAKFLRAHGGCLGTRNR